MSTYYVSTTGLDTASGTSPLSPWRTITRGITALVAGDVLIVRAGTYVESINNTLPSGNSTLSRTTLQAATGETVILRPSTGTGIGGDVVTLTNVSYVHLLNILMDASLVSANALRLSGTTNNCLIEGGECYNSPTNGVFVQDPTTISNIFRNGRSHHNGSDVDQHHGVYSRSPLTTFENWESDHNAGYGFHLFHQGATDVDDVTLDRISSHHNGGRGVLLSSGHRQILKQGIVYLNSKHGVEVDFGAVDCKILGTAIYGNTLTSLLIEPGVTGTIYRNVAAFGNGTDTVSNSGTGTVQSNNSIGVNPSWLDPANGDFRISTGSVCKDTGIALADYTVDRAGTPRPFGPAYDIGPYEFFTNVYSWTPTFGNSINVAWTANTDLDLAGYRLYVGTATGVYGTPTNVGNVTSYTIPNLTPGTKYFLALSAFDTTGNESAKTAEINETPGAPIILAGASPTLKTSQKAYLPSGVAFTVGGTAPHSRRRVVLPLGSGLQLAGTGLSTFQSGGHFTYTGSGTLVLGGTSPLARLRIYVPIQTPLTLSGSAPSVLATTRTSYSYTPAGTLTLGGSAPPALTHFPAASGGFVLGGSAPASKIISSLQSFVYTGSGAMVLSGTSPSVASRSYTGTGSLILSGSAPRVFAPVGSGSTVYSYDPSGDVFILEGTAGLTIIKTYIPALVPESELESIVIGGSAVTVFIPSSLPGTVTCPPFRLYRKDSTVEARQWGGDGEYAVVKPFGGPSFAEPSGAEI